jgi:hypothetical protein
MLFLADWRYNKSGRDNAKLLMRGQLWETCLFVVPLRETCRRRPQGQHALPASNYRPPST